jgi:hypothetical protein
MSDGPRSVKIDQNERGAWTSDRPGRDDEGSGRRRPVDISVRCRVLSPADRMRYSPGSLVLVTGPDEAALEELAGRVFEEQSAVLTAGKLRALVQGKVPAAQVAEKADELRAAVAAKRIAKGDSVVITDTGLDAADRDRWARLAAGHRRPRHLVFVDTKSEDEALVPTLNALRKAVDGGALGDEGFFTVLRLGGAAVRERRRIVFAPPPAQD